MISYVIGQTITFGAFYGLLAAGFNVVYRATNVFNFAQGELVMLGGMLTAVFVSGVTGNVVLAALIALSATTIVGLLIEAVAVRPIQRRDPTSHMWVISTLAVSLLLGDVAGKFWDEDPRFVPAPFGLSTRSTGLFGMSAYEIFMVATILAILIALEWVDRTRWGRATLAVAENREAALLAGIRPGAVARVAFAIGGLLAGLGGLMVAPILYASIGLGPLMLINGFIAAGVGGVGNPKGGLLGGVLVAGSGALTASYLDPGYQPLVTFALLLGVLLIRPNGLVGKVAGARV